MSGLNAPWFLEYMKDDRHRIADKLWEPKNRASAKADNKNHDGKSRLTGSLRYYRSATDRLDDSFESETTPIFLFDDKDVIMKQRKTEENFHRRMDEIYADRTGIGSVPQDITGTRLESRIPVPRSREREANGKETRIGTGYGRRRIQEGNSLKNWSIDSRVSDGSRQRSIQRGVDQSKPEINNSERCQRASRDCSPRRPSPTRDTYRSIYRQRRGFTDGNSVYHEVHTAPTATTATTTGHEVSRRRALKDSRGSFDSRGTTTEAQTTGDSRTNRRHAMADGYRVLNPSDRDRDKTTVDEEDCNDANQRNFSAQTNPYRIENPIDRSSQCPARLDNGPSETSSNSSSNTSGDEVRLEVLQNSPNERQSVEESFAPGVDGNLRSSPARSPITEKSFNVITHESNPSRRNSIEYGITANNAGSSTLVYSSTDPDNEEEDTDKGSSTDDASTVPIAQTSNGNFLKSLENENGDSSSEIEATGDHRSTRDVSASFVANESDSSSGGISKVSDDSPASNESAEIVDRTSNAATSPARINSIYAPSSIEAVGFDNSGTSIDENDGPDVTMAFVRDYPTDSSSEEPSRERDASPSVDDDKSVARVLSRSEEQRKKSDEREKEENEEEEEENETGLVKNTVSTPLVSRPLSLDPPTHGDASIQPVDFRASREVIGNSAADRIASAIARPPSGRGNESPKMSSSVAVSSNAIAPNFRRDSVTRGKINRSINTGNETAIKLVDVNGSGGTSEKSEAQRRLATSRVPRIRQKNRTNVSRVAPMPGGNNTDKNTTRAKSTTQQCLAQLESNDWESTVKGLKALSEIARQQPEQLDSFGPGTLGRLLGRHVRNLRSQVSRAACLAAGEVFGSQARCIDQELDDIAGPLLHRTADTNKFLRADSNEALDRMVEHLTPNKTILVIVHRGASHQNAIVRAATARLLASIVDRVGPDAVMSLPRDVREKLIASGAKLLMDGNLDARNCAKRMFRRLARCEGFRKALKDSVPEATLRHIDKTLKSL